MSSTVNPTYRYGARTDGDNWISYRRGRVPTVETTALSRVAQKIHGPGTQQRLLLR
jgi:hypothetical protein